MVPRTYPESFMVIAQISQPPLFSRDDLWLEMRAQISFTNGQHTEDK